jgi:hypothetical protein
VSPTASDSVAGSNSEAVEVDEEDEDEEGAVGVVLELLHAEPMTMTPTRSSGPSNFRFV